MEKNKKSIVYGPFIGEFLWELYYFVPHFIYKRKRNNTHKHIVITRDDRFDLYGTYADVLCPMRFGNDDQLKKDKFSIENLNEYSFDKIKEEYLKQLSKKYEIEKVVFPKIRGWYKEIKWQFPRDETDYEFHPRKENRLYVNACLKIDDELIFNETDELFSNYRNIRIDHIKQLMEKDNKLSYYGLIIEFLKHCHFYIGPFESEISRIAMLLGVPVITEEIDMDHCDIKTIDPINSVLIEEEYFKGVEIYETDIRPKKNRVGK